MPGVWNTSDLADWVRQQAVQKACQSDGIELEDWYRQTDSGNFWHGTCRDDTDKPKNFAINVGPVWTPSES